MPSFGDAVNYAYIHNLVAYHKSFSKSVTIIHTQPSVSFGFPDKGMYHRLTGYSSMEESMNA
jgi:hypothetical protein